MQARGDMFQTGEIAMRRSAALSILILSSATLSGCAFLGDAADTAWSGTKSAARFVSAPVRDLLRGTPHDDVVFASEVRSDAYGNDTVVSTELIDAPAPQPAPVYTPVYMAERQPVDFAPHLADPASLDGVPSAVIADPASIAFVRLNGDTNLQDWRTCENLHRGYWLVDAAGGRLNPDFEVCMRNKGYVREAEMAFYGFVPTAAVRGSDIVARRDNYAPGGIYQP